MSQPPSLEYRNCERKGCGRWITGMEKKARKKCRPDNTGVLRPTLWTPQVGVAVSAWKFGTKINLYQGSSLLRLLAYGVTTSYRSLCVSRRSIHEEYTYRARYLDRHKSVRGASRWKKQSFARFMLFSRDTTARLLTFTNYVLSKREVFI